MMRGSGAWLISSKIISIPSSVSSEKIKEYSKILLVLLKANRCIWVACVLCVLFSKFKAIS